MEERILLGPWLPPAEPGLGRLAWEAADAEGLARLDAWPERQGNGICFGGLPTFLVWACAEEGSHLLLFQAAELGAVVPGARAPGLPGGWLEALDFAGLARPLARHPDFPGGAKVHVVQVVAPGRARVRGDGDPPVLLASALEELTGIRTWEIVRVL